MLAAISKSTKAVSAGRRLFSCFSGADQTVYLAGKAVREIGGKKAEVAVAREITVVPGVSTVSIQSYTGASETTPADNTNIALLVGKDGAAKVKSISVEDPYTSASAKLTGANFKFTALKLSEAFADGEKVETEITFGDKDAPFSATYSGKAAGKETGKLSVVSFTEFLNIKNSVMNQIAAREAVRLNAVLAEVDAKNKKAAN